MATASAVVREGRRGAGDSADSMEIRASARGDASSHIACRGQGRTQPRRTPMTAVSCGEGGIGPDQPTASCACGPSGTPLCPLPCTRGYRRSHRGCARGTAAGPSKRSHARKAIAFVSSADGRTHEARVGCRLKFMALIGKRRDRSGLQREVVALSIAVFVVVDPPPLPIAADAEVERLLPVAAGLERYRLEEAVAESDVDDAGMVDSYDQQVIVETTRPRGSVSSSVIGRMIRAARRPARWARRQRSAETRSAALRQTLDCDSCCPGVQAAGFQRVAQGLGSGHEGLEAAQAKDRRAAVLRSRRLIHRLRRRLARRQRNLSSR